MFFFHFSSHRLRADHGLGRKSHTVEQYWLQLVTRMGCAYFKINQKGRIAGFNEKNGMFLDKEIKRRSKQWAISEFFKANLSVKFL